MMPISQSEFISLVEKVDYYKHPLTEVTFEEFILENKMASKYELKDVKHILVSQNNQNIDATSGDIIFVNQDNIPTGFVKCHQNYRLFYLF